jgi:glycerol-3-phosphate dehydrogenase (NAD(P)+)
VAPHVRLPRETALARLTVFGAGTMGTALAMHAARLGADVALWANPYDERALEAMRTEGRHPLLHEHLPPDLPLFGPDELEKAAERCEVAVMAASSGGARSLATMTSAAVRDARFVVSLAKGLESETGKRCSEAYAEEIPGPVVVAVGGPCLAAELAEGAPSAAVWAGPTAEEARDAAGTVRDRRYQLVFTDDVLGVELCSVTKNVAAIGMGILDGLGKLTEEHFRNAQAALFTRAVFELAELVTALGGRRETAMGLAGLGDVLVTGLGGRNRAYGERVGEGAEPVPAHAEMTAQGMTVEGVEAARDVHRMAAEQGLDLPYHEAVFRVLFEGTNPRSVFDVLC